MAIHGTQLLSDVADGLSGFLQSPIDVVATAADLTLDTLGDALEISSPDLPESLQMSLGAATAHRRDSDSDDGEPERRPGKGGGPPRSDIHGGSLSRHIDRPRGSQSISDSSSASSPMRRATL